MGQCYIIIDIILKFEFRLGPQCVNARDWCGKRSRGWIITIGIIIFLNIIKYKSGTGKNWTGTPCTKRYPVQLPCGVPLKAAAFGTNYTIDAFATQAEAIYGKTEAASKAAIRGEANASGSMGVFGTSILGYGVRGFSGGGTGVHASTNTGHGINASANTGVGIRTSSTSGNALEVFGKLKIYGSAVNPQNGPVF